jgi:RNA polymerase sigma-70 factor (ECF subfamily)
VIPVAPDDVRAPTDAELMAAHRRGDPQAFGLLAERSFGRLWGVAMRMLGHPDDASDAVQEALIAALRRAHTYRGDASVSTWLCRITVNVCIDRIRRDRTRPTVAWGDRDLPARSDPAGELVTRLAVDEALAALPVEQRVAVVLVDVQGWPVAEVARLEGVPVGTVKSRCARARTRLAELLGHLREEDR